MPLNLRQIEVFRAFMLTGSVSGASQLLHVSQPAVSRLLSYTESRLGFALFERIKGRLYPTPEARQLFLEVESVYQGVQRVNETAGNLLEKRAVTLRVCCSPSLSQTLLPRALAYLGLRYPDLRIYLDTQNSADLIQTLLTQRFEVGVSIQPIEHPNLECHPLRDSRMVVAMAKDHRLAQRTVLTLGDIAEERLIAYRPDTPLGILLAAAFRKAGQSMKRVIEVRHTHTACSLAQSGAGVAIVDGLSIMGGNWPHIVTRPLKPRIAIRVCAVHSRFHPLSMIGRELLALLPNVERLGVDPVDGAVAAS